MTDRGPVRISELVVRCCHGAATNDDISELECLLSGSQEAMEYCAELLLNLSYFHSTSSLTSQRLAGLVERLAAADECGDSMQADLSAGRPSHLTRLTSESPLPSDDASGDAPEKGRHIDYEDRRKKMAKPKTPPT